MCPLDLIQTRRLLSSASWIMRSWLLLDHLGTEPGVSMDDLCTCSEFYGYQRMLLLLCLQPNWKISPISRMEDMEHSERRDQFQPWIKAGSLKGVGPVVLSLWCLGHASPRSCLVLRESVGCHSGTGGVSPRHRCAVPSLEDADGEQETHWPQGCCSNFMALHGPLETQPRRGNESLPAGVGQSLLQPMYEKTLFMDSVI